MKKAVIFGVTGQDGSHLTDLLLEKNYKVVGVSRRCRTPNTSRLSNVINNKNFILESGDITDTHSVYNILNKH